MKSRDGAERVCLAGDAWGDPQGARLVEQEFSLVGAGAILCEKLLETFATLVAGFQQQGGTIHLIERTVH